MRANGHEQKEASEADRKWSSGTKFENKKINWVWCPVLMCHHSYFGGAACEFCGEKIKKQCGVDITKINSAGLIR
jgi:hypothetical protein